MLPATDLYDQPGCGRVEIDDMGAYRLLPITMDAAELLAANAAPQEKPSVCHVAT